VHRALGGARPRLRVESRFLGPGYGVPSAESLAAVADAARCGLRIDPIYTGKALAALLADARAGRLDNKRVLFIQSFSSIDGAPPSL
jgi:D-cysteine desulfhydrase